MNKSLMRSVQTAYILSVNVVTQSNGQFYFSTIPIVRLTGLIFVILSIPETINRQWVIVRNLPQVITQAILDLCEGWFLLVNTLLETMLKTMFKTYAGNYQGGLL